MKQRLSPLAIGVESGPRQGLRKRPASHR